MPYQYKISIRLISCFLILFNSCIISVCQTTNIHGYIKTIDSEEPLVGAIIIDTLSGVNTVTNAYGYYVLPLSNLKPCLKVSYIGHQDTLYCFTNSEKNRLDFSLKTNNNLKTVEVLATPSTFQLNKVNSGILQMPATLIKSMPQIGGEVDILKTIALMPGVTLGTEGTSMVLIRGSTPGQNLILLDDAPVYNVNHLGPILSVFNIDVIKNVRVMKAAMPAVYGGRVGGLIDISTKEGNQRFWSGRVGISPVMSRFFLEGPIVPQKTSFLFASRVAWLGLMSRIFDTTDEQQRYLMYDMNAKITHEFNDQHKLYFSFYTGEDNLRYKERSFNVSSGEGFNYERVERIDKTRWGNLTGTIRYQTFLNNQISFESILYYTKYHYGTSGEDEFFLAEDEFAGTRKESTNSENRDIGGKFIVNYFHDKFNVKAGTELVSQFFEPENSFLLDDLENTLSRSVDVFQQNYFTDFQIFPQSKWTTNFGLRYSFYQTTNQNYHSWEPRLMVRWKITPNLSWRWSGNYGKQFIHLLYGGTDGRANEVWVSSNERVKPSEGWQLATSGLWQAKENRWQVEMDFYYKKSKEILDFKSLNDDEFTGLSEWENLIETGGEGETKGLELLVKRNAKKWNGWLGYTLSWNKHRFDNINDGDWFPFRFDRRHDISLVGQYQLSEKWKLSATWIYQTGIVVSLPEAAIILNPSNPELARYILTRRNNARLPDYHRMDVSMVRTWEGKRGGRHHLAFSIYNLYNRANPFQFEIHSEPIFQSGAYVGSTPPQLKTKSLLPIIPSVSYDFEFGKKK